MPYPFPQDPTTNLYPMPMKDLGAKRVEKEKRESDKKMRDKVEPFGPLIKDKEKPKDDKILIDSAPEPENREAEMVQELKQSERYGSFDKRG